VLLNEIDSQTLRFRRHPTITSPLERAFIRAPGSIPIRAPEIVLLYNSCNVDADNWSDFPPSCPSTLADAPSSARRSPVSRLRGARHALA
jgi:hypothetical protein